MSQNPKGCTFCRQAFPAMESLGSLRWLHKEFKDPAVYTSRLRDGLPQEARGISTGLYLLLVHNSEDEPVRDSNPGRKIVVPPKAATLKPGKFQNGLIARQRENYRHAHRKCGSGVQRGIYPELLQRLLVLDLGAVAKEMDSSGRTSPARSKPSWKGYLRTLETCLQRRVRHFLKPLYCDPHQSNRSEARWLRPGAVISDGDLRALMQAVLSEHDLRLDERSA